VWNQLFFSGRVLNFSLICGHGADGQHWYKLFQWRENSISFNKLVQLNTNRKSKLSLTLFSETFFPSSMKWKPLWLLSTKHHLSLTDTISPWNDEWRCPNYPISQSEFYPIKYHKNTALRPSPIFCSFLLLLNLNPLPHLSFSLKKTSLTQHPLFHSNPV